MKKLLSVLALAVLLLLACAPQEEAAAEFFISFLFDGEAVEFTEGALEYENVPLASYSTDEDITFMAAVPQGVPFAAEPETYVMIGVRGVAQVGTYDVETAEALVTYIIGGTEFFSISGSVTITVAGGVGATIEGTFSTQVTSDLLTFHDVTGGAFRVKRFADDIGF